MTVETIGSSFDPSLAGFFQSRSKEVVHGSDDRPKDHNQEP